MFIKTAIVLNDIKITLVHSCWTLTKQTRLSLVDEAANQSSAAGFEGLMMTFVGNGERKMPFPPSLSAAPTLRDRGIMGNNFHGDRWA